jgi:hypothetical protein
MLFPSFLDGDALWFLLSIDGCFSPKHRWDLLCELHKSARSIDANEARIKRLMHTVCREMPGIEDVFLKQCLSHHQAITAHFPARRHKNYAAEVPNQNGRNLNPASATVKPRRGASLVSTQLQFEQATPAHVAISQPQPSGRDAHDAYRSTSIASSGPPVKSSHAAQKRLGPAHQKGEWLRNERASTSTAPQGEQAHASINQQNPIIKPRKETSKGHETIWMGSDPAHATSFYERTSSSLGAHASEVTQPGATSSSTKPDSKMRMRALLKWQVKSNAHVAREIIWFVQNNKRKTPRELAWHTMHPASSDYAIVVM